MNTPPATDPVSSPPSETTDRAPAPEPVAGAGSLDAGPVVEFPILRTILAVVGAAAAVGLGAWPIAVLVRPGGQGAIVGAAASVVAAFLLGLVVMRPWRARPVGRWMVAWLAGRGVCFIAVLAIGALLYSATRVDAAVFWLVIGAGYFVALLSEALVFASTLKSRQSGTAV